MSTQKTQITLPAPLHRQAKVHAIEKGVTFSKFVEDALAAALPVETPRKKKGAAK